MRKCRNPDGANLAWIVEVATTRPWPEECLTYPGALKGCGPKHAPRLGYGIVWYQNRSVSAHRLAYELAFGPVAAGLDVLHRCLQNRACCNPTHLYAGTAQQNADDAHRDGTWTHGTAVNTAVLCESQVIEIRRRHREGESVRRLSFAFGLSDSAMRSVVRRQSWKHVLEAP